MAPPMPNPTKRMTAQPSRPVQRYRPGKAVAEEESSDEEESEGEKQQQTRTQARSALRQPQSRPQVQQAEDEDDEEEGFVTDPDDEEDGGVRVPTQKPAAPSAKPTVQPRTQSRPVEEESEEEGSEEDSDDDSDDESSEQESSSDEEPRRKFQRPTFIKKLDRQNSSTPAVNGASLTLDPVSTEPETKERRVAEADIILRQKLKRDVLARAAGRRAWDDDDDLAAEDLVNDTDGVDPEAEHAAWRLRELKRLKRDREAMIAREKEIEEIERRRNLTAEEREKEDKEFLSKQKEEKEEGRGQAAYLSRYHHKGAFFQDDEEAQLLAKRDLVGAKFQDEVSDKSALPEYMRLRDMTKLGKKGRTRYKDLRAEDTGQFGDDRRKRWDGSLKEGGGEDLRGVDARFLPDDDRTGGPRASGANASALGARRGGSRSPRRRDDNDSHKRRQRSYSRSRSRSPPRGKRSPSPYRDRDRDRDRDWDRDKRRRVDAI